MTRVNWRRLYDSVWDDSSDSGTSTSHCLTILLCSVFAGARARASDRFTVVTFCNRVQIIADPYDAHRAETNNKWYLSMLSHVGRRVLRTTAFGRSGYRNWKLYTVLRYATKRYTCTRCTIVHLFTFNVQALYRVARLPFFWRQPQFKLICGIARETKIFFHFPINVKIWMPSN